MPVEIEAKIKVEDLAAVRRTLEQIGATYVGVTLETNVFFDTDDRSLLAADEGLRLRRNRNVADGTESFVITFKGPRHPGQMKSRDETELSVSSFDEAAALITRLGFAQVLSFEKKRESWKLDGCKIELDELPLLGTYVEIEGPRESVIQKVREKMELQNRSVVKASYVALLMTHLQEHGQSSRTISFKN